MSEIKTIKKADNFTTVDFGKLNELSNYVLELGPDMRIPGKVFGGKAVLFCNIDFYLYLYIR